MWSVSGRTGHDEVAVGCDGGSIRVHKLHFQHVRAIYRVREREEVFFGVQDFRNRCRTRATTRQR